MTYLLFRKTKHNFNEYLIQHSLKSGDTKDHFRQVKVLGTARYWKACEPVFPWTSKRWSWTSINFLNCFFWISVGTVDGNGTWKNTSWNILCSHSSASCWHGYQAWRLGLWTNVFISFCLLFFSFHFLHISLFHWFRFVSHFIGTRYHNDLFVWLIGLQH
jgi:hypothetical protein